METFEIIMMIIIFGGLAIAVYYFLKEPGQILKDLINMMKNGGIRGAILFFPIWFPVWIIDKIFKLNILEPWSFGSLKNDDKLYDSEWTEKIDFKDYNKYVIVNSTDIDKIIELINDFNKTHQVKCQDYKFCKFDTYGTLLKNDDLSFYEYINLMQWLETIGNNKLKTLGILKNKTDKIKSVIMENDQTGKHINSLIGKNYNNDKFSIYIVDEFTDGDYLSYNNSIDYTTNFKFDRYFDTIEKLKFEKLEKTLSA